MRARSCRVGSNRRGESIKVLRWSEPRRTNSLLQAGNHAQYAALFGIGHLGLESDHIVETCLAIVLAQLDDGERTLRGARVGESHRLHRTEGKRVMATACQFLDRHAAFEVDRAFERMERELVGGQYGADKGVILRLVHRAIDIIVAAFTLTRSLEGDFHVDRFRGDDRSDGVVEIKVAWAEQTIQLVAQGGAGKRAGRDDARSRGQCGGFGAYHFDQRMALQRRGKNAREPITVDGQRRASGNLRAAGGVEHERPQPTHLLFEQAHCGFERGVA